MAVITKMFWFDDIDSKPVATRYTAYLRYDDREDKPYRVHIEFSYNSSKDDVQEFKSFKFQNLKDALNCYNDLKVATEAKTIQ